MRSGSADSGAMVRVRSTLLSTKGLRYQEPGGVESVSASADSSVSTGTAFNRATNKEHCNQRGFLETGGLYIKSGS